MTPRFVQEALTPQELAKLAEVSPSDVQAAKSAWRRDAPTAFRNLLDATVPDEEDEEE